MSSVLSLPVLTLNRHWQPISDDQTVEQAIVAMTGGKNGVPSKLGMHVELEVDENGNYSLGTGTRPCPWEEWIGLDIRNDHHQDRAVHTHRYTWRAPSVIICTVYDEMPMKKLRWSTGNVRVRDGGICQVSQQKLSKGEGNVAHDVALHRGGKNTFENTVYLRKDLNTLMGTRTFAEMGWKLARKPKAPPALPMSVTITEVKHVQWLPFLPHLKN